MRNFYHTCNFSILTINFSEVWSRQILDLGKQFNLMIHLENVLKTSLPDVLKMSWRHLEDIFKTSWKRFCKMSSRSLQEIFQTSCQDVLKMSWRRLENEWPRQIYWSWSRGLEDVLKMSSEDLWVRRIYSSWSRHLEDVIWRWKTSSRRVNEDEYIRLGHSSSRHLQGVFKTSSRRLHQDMIKTNVCWEGKKWYPKL